MAARKTPVRTWVCRMCGLKFSVLLSDPHAQLLPKRIKCYACKPASSRSLLIETEHAVGDVLSAMDIFKTHMGFGTESERKCSPERLMRLLVGKKVVAIELSKAADKNRSLVSTMTFEDNITIYLAPSIRGVTIYKVVGA